MNITSRDGFKKGINKIKHQSQKNILGEKNKHNMTINMTIADDVVMIDENTNPNTVIDNDNTVYENKNISKKRNAKEKRYIWIKKINSET